MRSRRQTGGIARPVTRVVARSVARPVARPVVRPVVRLVWTGCATWRKCFRFAMRQMILCWAWLLRWRGQIMLRKVMPQIGVGCGMFYDLCGWKRASS